MLNQQAANIQERKELKNGTVLYTVLGSKGYKYFITVKDGEIDPETHQDCDGFHFCHQCYHIRDINAMESEIASEKKLAAAVETCRKSFQARCEAFNKAQDEWEARPPYKPQGLEETYSAAWYPKSDRY